MTCFATLYIVQQVAKFDVTLKRNNRVRQHSMTSDPNKVWPKGILPYEIDRRICTSKSPGLSGD